VIVTALLARELGATRRGELAAATGVAIAPMFVTIGHFQTTVTAEVVAWTVAVLLLARLLRGGDPRLWVAVGAAVGVGLFDKWTTLLLVAGLAVGLLTTRARRALVTPWAFAGAAIALGLWLPTVHWQATHGWPQLELSRHLRSPVLPVFTAPYQVVLLGAASVVAIPGLRRLLGSDAEPRDRALGMAFAAIVALVMVTGAKPYYAGAFGPVLVAAGAAQRGWVPSGRVFVTMGAIGLMTAPFSLPLLPRSTAKVTTLANRDIGEMVGWPELVDVAARLHARYPAAGIFTANYSEAASIEILGRGRGLPQPFSGHNAYWFWAHPHGTSAETLVVGFHKRDLDRFFTDVERVATFRSPEGVPNLENGSPIWVVRGQRASWDALWPRLKHIQ
jgi:hypothetical protein